MSNVFIIHGTGGNPEGNWFPWLKSELEEIEHKVIVLNFPTPEDQNLSNWLDIINNYKDEINGETIFVGHSLGSAFILSVLEDLDSPIKASFLVAGFVGLLGLDEFDNLNDSFVTKEFNWGKIKKNCKNFFIINSDNDPYVPLEKGEYLAEKLETKVFVIEKAGHINRESGFTEFPILLDLIKEEING